MSASLRERRGSGSTGLEADADVVLDRARAAIEEEHSMTLWSAVKSYPKAIGWSVLASTCIVMEGYDLVVSLNFGRQMSLTIELTFPRSSLASSPFQLSQKSMAI